MNWKKKKVLAINSLQQAWNYILYYFLVYTIQMSGYHSFFRIFFKVSYAHQECIFDQKYGKNYNVLEYYYRLNELLVFNMSYYYEKQLCCLMSF